MARAETGDLLGVEHISCHINMALSSIAKVSAITAGMSKQKELPTYITTTAF